MPISLENYTEEQRAQLARTAHALLNNPEVSRETKRLIKKLDPSVQFPELDMDDRFNAFKAEQDEKETKKQEQERVRAANAQWEDACKRMEKRGHKVDDVKKVMTERGIVNPDTAMEYMENLAQLAPPTPDSLGYTVRLPDAAKEISKNPAQWAKSEAHAAVNELMRQQRNG